MSTTITWNGDKLLVQADGRAIVGMYPDKFFSLSPDVDLHETAALAIANKGVPQHVLGSTRVVRPRHATVHSIAM